MNTSCIDCISFNIFLPVIVLLIFINMFSCLIINKKLIIKSFYTNKYDNVLNNIT